MANEDTRSTADNTGGAPAIAALSNYRNAADCPVSIAMLAEYTGATCEEVTAQLKALEQQNIVSISTDLHHVIVQPVDGAEPVPDGGETAEPAVSNVDLTPAEIFQIFSNKRRRKLIGLLARRSDATGGGDNLYVAVSSAAAVVCANGDAFDTEMAPSAHEGYHATYTSLTQTHLPLLEELGIIDYFDRAQKVHPTDTLLALNELLDIVDDVASEEADT